MTVEPIPFTLDVPQTAIDDLRGRPARACCARTAFQTSPQHCGTTRESSDALAWRRMTARGTLSRWSNWTAGDVNGLFLIISDQEMPKIGFMRLN